MQINNPASFGTLPAPQPRAEQTASVPSVPTTSQAGQAAGQQPQPRPKQDVTLPSKEDLAADKVREEFIRKAAELYRTKTFYPISDTRFTIYRDASGEFITRFTNMVDGSVRHIPEPGLVDFYARTTGNTPVISTKA